MGASSDLGQPFRPRQKKVGVWVGRRVGYLATTFALREKSYKITCPDGAVAMLSANGLVGTGFASQYRLQSRAGF